MEGLEDDKNAELGCKPHHIDRCAIHLLVSMCTSIPSLILWGTLSDQKL